ncbi:hypothetical protein CEXT_169591 [Caerostris extrusa]|uniref:Uncharacterized protein n=1 Tax=Caerostris extrusa TaxID=172846 RepID=A0AAV4XLI4_CAEEX|nr:hypothetical protein CEXT_169591 [Caerostris extrusa]
MAALTIVKCIISSTSRGLLTVPSSYHSVSVRVDANPFDKHFIPHSSEHKFIRRVGVIIIINLINHHRNPEFKSDLIQQVYSIPLDRNVVFYDEDLRRRGNSISSRDRRDRLQATIFFPQLPSERNSLKISFSS